MICETCKRPPDAVNHVPGFIFVGWGVGWQRCPACGGSGMVPDPLSADPSFELSPRHSTAFALAALDRAIARNRQPTPEEERAAFDALWSPETRARHSSLAPHRCPPPGTHGPGNYGPDSFGGSDFP